MDGLEDAEHKIEDDEDIGIRPVQESGAKMPSNVTRVGINNQGDEVYTSKKTTVQDLISSIQNIIKTDSKEFSNSTKIKIITDKMTELMAYLLENSWQDSHRDNCLDMFVEHDVFNEVYNWTASNKEIMKGMTKELLIIYNNVLSIGSDTFIRLKEFVDPLLLLLLALRPVEKKRMPFDMELSYIKLLNSLCLRLIDEEFLQRFQSVHVSKQGYKLPRYAFMNLLMFYIHEDNEIGNFARDSLIICMQISATCEKFGEFIAMESDCCNILAAGLSGLYSSLPTTLDIITDDWYCITKEMLSENKEIKSFVKAVRFCCEVLKFGHPAIKQRLSSLIHDGFLSSVLASTLHQPITEAVVAAIAYLELLIREVNESNFMKIILKFLFMDAYDDRLIIDTLIDRIQSTSPPLCMVTLQLFKTLMDLNCEDIVFHLMIRYLIPCHHLLPNQKRIVKELDFYCKSATMFLYLTPSCCLEVDATQVPTENGVIDGNEVPVSIAGKANKPLMFHRRQSFTECLQDARIRVQECKRACQCWSAVYDGMDVMTDHPRRTGSSVLVAQSQSDRRNSEIFSFAMRRKSSASEREMERTRVSKTPSLPADYTPSVKKTEMKINNGYSDMLENVSYSSSNDCLGPFISTLYAKLEKMADNSYYINLQLTSLISRIACYPQPLLRSLLLNSNLVMKPGVKSLFQILTNVTHSTEFFISQLDDYQALVFRARQNLIRRDKKFYNFVNGTGRRDSTSSTLSVATDAKKSNNVDEPQLEGGNLAKKINTSHASKNVDTLSRKDSLYTESPTDLPSYNTGTRIGKLHPAIRSPQKKGTDSTVRANTENLRKKNPTLIKNAVYTAIILEEWLKELAAISLEHNLV